VEVSDPEARYQVIVTDGVQVHVEPDADYWRRNRLVDFAFRHGLRWCVSPAAERVRGKGTYR